MDDVVDHYILLGLPSGEEGAQLSDKDITKAYKKKALELHPDKRPNDRNAHADILRLNASYAILKDATARKLFDDVMRAKRETALRQSQQGSKRRKMVSDLEGREKAAFSPDPVTKAQMEEERITRKFNEEVARIRAQHANKVASTTPRRMEDATVGGRENKGGGGGSGLDKEKMLKVSWEKIGKDYSAQRLKDLFQKFGEVKDVVIRSSKKKGSAIIEMASKDAAVAATGSVCGDLSNPLLVLPLDPAKTTAFSSPLKHAEPEGTMPSNLVGAGHQLFEDSILKKMMQKAAEKQK